MYEGVRHLNADISSSHDDDRAWFPFPELSIKRERVFHGMESMYTGEVRAGNRRNQRSGASRDQEPVIREGTGVVLPVDHFHRLSGRINRSDSLPLPYFNAFKFCSVSELVPVWSFPAEEKRQPADTEIRISISQHNSDRCFPIQLSCPQGSANSSVTTADNQETHATPIAVVGNITTRVGRG